MKNSFVQEITISVILIVLLGLLLMPLDFMPPPFFMPTLVAVVIAFVLFTVFVWREKASDEREAFHGMLAGRIGFLAGAATLVFAIIVQGLRHAIDPWLLVTLGVMVFGKAVAFIYGKLRR